MKAIFNELIASRVIELEGALECEDEFRNLSNEQYNNLLALKGIVSKGNWILLDEYICSKNAECEYIMNYFYCRGFCDGKNIIN